jgi:hypothetical protein
MHTGAACGRPDSAPVAPVGRDHLDSILLMEPAVELPYDEYGRCKNSHSDPEKRSF